MQKDLELYPRIRDVSLVHSYTQLAYCVAHRGLSVDHEDDGVRVLERKVELFRIELTSG